jgi:hypothetical protein
VNNPVANTLETNRRMELTKRERAQMIRDRDETRRRERRERNRDRSVYSASPDTEDERYLHEDSKARVRRASRDLRKDFSCLVINGVEIKTFNHQNVFITAFLATIKRLFEQYSEDLTPHEFLQELAIKLFSSLDQVWINIFMSQHPEPIWPEIERAFIEAFRSPDSGISSAAEYSKMYKKPLWEESVHDWFAKNQTYFNTMASINPNLVPSNMYSVMCTQISMGADKDKTGSLNRLRDVYLESWMGGNHGEILSKLLIAESSWLASNPAPKQSTKVSTANASWDDIVEYRREDSDHHSNARVNELSIYEKRLLI